MYYPPNHFGPPGNFGSPNYYGPAANYGPPNDYGQMAYGGPPVSIPNNAYAPGWNDAPPWSYAPRNVPTPFGYRTAANQTEMIPWGNSDLQHGPEPMVTRPPYLQARNWQKQYPNQVVIHGSREAKGVALTFDNAPDALFTPAILQLLAAENVRATFCCIGTRIRQYPELVRRMAAHGHTIVNHSFSHPDFTRISGADAQVQLTETAVLIEETTGAKPIYFRPPYGATNESVIQTAAECQHKLLLWDVDSLDWTGIRGHQMATHVLAHTRPGSIIALHCDTEGNRLVDQLQAIRYIIAILKFEGCEFMTIQELCGR